LYELAKVESRLIFQSVYPIGPPNALARALSYAQGEWVGFLDDDDYLAFDCLEKCIQAVEGLKIGMLYTSYFEDRNNSYSPGPKNRMPYPEGRLFLNALPFHFKFINREALLKIGGINSSFLFAWDYDMCLRLSEVAEIHHLPIPLYYYRIHPEQLSQSKLIDQVYYTYQAIEASLRRRGLDKKFRLTIEPTYRLENIL
jgi:glycosyltransferase involved in cell wall biosynthesis